MLSVISVRRAAPVALLFSAVLLSGCFSSPAQFRRYETYARKVSSAETPPPTGLTENQWKGIDETMTALFGTPDEPQIPKVAKIGVVLDAYKLKRASGAVHSDELGVGYGLYREHCAHCHGVTGDGNGPTAPFLNPYPRDYRMGLFKFKSTPSDYKPTHADLKKIVYDGIPGTAMPSFKLLPDEEVEALVHYVKYLAIRGETERELLRGSNEELDEGQRLVSFDDSGKESFESHLELINNAVNKVVGKWLDADANVVEIPQRKAMTQEELIASRKRGRDLFYGTVANCAKCHGDSALGDGTTNDYDNWTKDIVDPGKPETTKETIDRYVALGFPEPRTIRPRNLRQGVFRGGNRPIDIYWRVKNGIGGTPMPAATVKPADNPNAKGLTPDDIWDIVNYVQHLPYEPLSQPPEAIKQPEQAIH